MELLILPINVRNINKVYQVSTVFPLLMLFSVLGRRSKTNNCFRWLALYIFLCFLSEVHGEEKTP